MSIFDTQAPADPRKQECVGFYLYGSGYFDAEDETMANVKGTTKESFCHTCPALEKCSTEHGEQVRAKNPEAADEFEREVRKAAAKGITPELLTAAMMRRGEPDPFTRAALANFKRGEEDRRRSYLSGFGNR